MLVREQSAPTLRSLVKAGHALVMITGDSPLTACHVAARTHIVTRAPLILSPVLPGADRWQVRAHANMLDAESYCVGSDCSPSNRGIFGEATNPST